jgi:uncharacterized membrane protein
MDRSFSRSDAIRYGWQTAKENIGYFIGLMILFFLINASFAFTDNELRSDNGHSNAVHAIFTIASMIFQQIMAIGLLRIAVGFCDQKKLPILMLFSGWDCLWRYIGGAIIFVVLVMVGFILLIIPGIYIILRLQLFSFFVVDRDVGPIEAIMLSWSATRGVAGNLFVFHILLGLINILGALCLGIGVFWTFPLSMIAIAYVYRTLLAQMAEDGSLAAA